MANEIFKEIKTRIALKTLDLAGWEAIKDTYKPLKGEVCICEIPTGNSVPTANSVTPPTVLFKVGDGEHVWSQLNWASALAADVYNWAKQDKLFTAFAAGAEGQGNAITSVEWDVGQNNGKGGLLFKRQTVFATKAELDAAVEAFGGDLSAITDNDHIYTFSIPETGEHAGQLMVIAEHKVNGETASTETKYFDFVTPEELTTILDIPTELGVMSVELLAGATNGSLKLKVNGEEGDDVVVTGLEEIKVKNATHADAAGKVDNALTVKVGGADVVFDGFEAKTADIDAAIGAAIDAAKVDYTVTCADTDHEATENAPAFKRHTLTQNGKQICVIDVPRDLVIKSGSVDKEKNELVLVLVNDEEVRVDVSHLIEYVTGGTAPDGIITVDVDDNFVATATINDGTVTEAKLHADVAAKLNKEWQPIGDYQPAGDYKIVQEEVVKTGSTVKTVTEIKQDTNGVITEVKFEDIAFPECVAGGSATIATVANDIVTLKTGAVLNADHTLANDTGADITLAKVAKTGSAYDLAEANVTEDGVMYFVLDCNW